MLKRILTERHIPGPSEEKEGITGKDEGRDKMEWLDGPKINLVCINVFFSQTTITFGKEEALEETKTFG